MAEAKGTIHYIQFHL